jgi:predicted Zn-dependent protease
VRPSHVARLFGWGFGCIAVPVLLRADLGRPWGAIGTLLVTLATGWLVLYLPRAAHRNFTQGKLARAHRSYRFLELMAFSARRQQASRLSRAACKLAAGQLALAEELLAGVDPARLDVAERVVWLNNRACAVLDAARDPHDALALVEEATQLRPDVPGVQHTRARALLAVGRVDDAITVLDAMRAGGELAPHLEAERCRELASAWERKGQGDYAADYRERARLHAV